MDLMILTFFSNLLDSVIHNYFVWKSYQHAWTPQGCESQRVQLPCLFFSEEE